MCREMLQEISKVEIVKLPITGGLPNLIDLASGDTESLYRDQYRTPRSTIEVATKTHRCDPFFTSTLNAGPIEITNLGTALFVWANDLARDVSILEHPLHPCKL